LFHNLDFVSNLTVYWFETHSLKKRTNQQYISEVKGYFKQYCNSS